MHDRLDNTIEQTLIILVSVVSAVSRFFFCSFWDVSLSRFHSLIAIVINEKYEKIRKNIESLTLYGQWIYIVTSISYIMYLSWCFIWLYTEIWFQGKQQFFFVVSCADGADKTEKKNVFFCFFRINWMKLSRWGGGIRITLVDILFVDTLNVLNRVSWIMMLLCFLSYHRKLSCRTNHFKVL